MTRRHDDLLIIVTSCHLPYKCLLGFMGCQSHRLAREFQSVENVPRIGAENAGLGRFSVPATAKQPELGEEQHAAEHVGGIVGLAASGIGGVSRTHHRKHENLRFFSKIINFQGSRIQVFNTSKVAGALKN